MDNNFDQEQLQPQENLENQANLHSLAISQQSIEDYLDQKIQIQQQQAQSQLKTFQSSFQNYFQADQESNFDIQNGILSQSRKISQIIDEQDESGYDLNSVCGINQEQRDQFKQNLLEKIQTSIKKLVQLSNQMKDTDSQIFSPSVLEGITQQADIFNNLKQILESQNFFNSNRYQMEEDQAKIGIQEFEENRITLSYELIEFNDEESQSFDNQKRSFQKIDEKIGYENKRLSEPLQIQINISNQNLDQIHNLQQIYLSVNNPFRLAQSVYLKSFDQTDCKDNSQKLQLESRQVDSQKDSSSKVIQSIQFALNSKNLDFKRIEQQEYDNLGLDQKILLMKDYLEYALLNELSLQKFQELFKKFTDYFYDDEKTKNFKEKQSCHKQVIKFVESFYDYEEVEQQPIKFDLNESEIIYQFCFEEQQQFQIDESIILLQYTANNWMQENEN